MLTMLQRSHRSVVALHGEALAYPLYRTVRKLSCGFEGVVLLWATFADCRCLFVVLRIKMKPQADAAPTSGRSSSTLRRGGVTAGAVIVHLSAPHAAAVFAYRLASAAVPCRLRLQKQSWCAMSAPPRSMSRCSCAPLPYTPVHARSALHGSATPVAAARSARSRPLPASPPRLPCTFYRLFEESCRRILLSSGDFDLCVSSGV